MATASPHADPSAPVHRWTRLHIALHWFVVALVALQYFDGEWMSAFFDGGLEGADLSGTVTTFGYLHIAGGLAIFAAIAVRLWDRTVHGRPPHPAGEPNWAAKLAALTQTLLYVTLLAMPVAGLVAWLTGNDWLAGQHSFAAEVLIALLVLHVSGALANHFWFKTDVLRRMLPGQGR